MPSALESISLENIDLAPNDTDRSNPSIIAGFPTETQSETNWCWAAVGSGLYNYWLKSANPISQSTFATKFGNTQENKMRDPLAIIEALEQHHNDIPRHTPLQRRQLRNADNLWNQIKSSIAAQKPVPLAIRWDHDYRLGHMLCILGLSSLDGTRAAVIYDPAGNDAFHDNVRQIIFSRNYFAEYRDLNGDFDEFSGHISVAFIP